MLFCVSQQEPLEYVKAVANYVTRESTLLSFHKGDVIQVVRDEQYVDKGKLFIWNFFNGFYPFVVGEIKQRRYAVVCNW